MLTCISGIDLTVWRCSRARLKGSVLERDEIKDGMIVMPRDA